MSDTLIFLQLEHGGIVKLLTLLEVHADRIEAGREPDLSLLRLAFEYFRDYPDACHHPKEDVVFRRLLDRDPVAAARVGDLLGDHRELAKRTQEMVEFVDGLEGEHSAATDTLAGKLRAFATTYRHHLESEDRYFFPAAAECLRREDWDLIDFTVFDARDPLFDSEAENRFAELRRAIWVQADGDEGASSAGAN